MIRFENVSKHYGNHTDVVHAFNLVINQGEFFVIFGPEKSGKSTILRMINRLVEPSNGVVTVNKQLITDLPIRALRQDVGYVVEDIALFPNLTVLDNLTLSHQLRACPKDERLRYSQDIIEKVGLGYQTCFYKPEHLTQLEQQKVGLARAFIMRPEIVLMDNPFKRFAAQARKELQSIVRQLQEEFATTIVFVTDNMNEALVLADRICVLESGQIVQVDTPIQLRGYPSNEYVAEFFQHDLAQNIASLTHYTVQDVAAIGMESADPNSIQRYSSAQTLSPEAPLSELIQLLILYDTVPVVKQGKMIGLLSKDRLLAFLERQVEAGV